MGNVSNVKESKDSTWIEYLRRRRNPARYTMAHGLIITVTVVQSDLYIVGNEVLEPRLRNSS